MIYEALNGSIEVLKDQSLNIVTESGEILVRNNPDDTAHETLIDLMYQISDSEYLPGALCGGFLMSAEILPDADGVSVVFDNTLERAELILNNRQFRLILDED